MTAVALKIPMTEDSYTAGGFERLAKFINDETGIKLPPTKQTMLEGRLRKRINMLGFNGLPEYCSYLFGQNALEDERTFLIDAITTNKTDFFREPEHFDWLLKFKLPEFLAARSAAPLKIWSAASSIGAEAYTIAMLLAEQVRFHPSLTFAILGTDISSQVIEQARRAVYSEDMITPVPPELQRRYLMKSRSPGERLARVVPELRRCVQFAEMNLMDATYPVEGGFDVIFLRNVLIYFEPYVQKEVVSKLALHLKRGGHIVLGHSEARVGSELGMRQVVAGVFEV